MNANLQTFTFWVEANEKWAIVSVEALNIEDAETQINKWVQISLKN